MVKMACFKVNLFVFVLFIFILALIEDINALNFKTTDLSLRNLTRIRRQSCSGFVCKSGQCISDDNVCDGNFDCLDGSDETSSICESLTCPSYLQRCKYGACVKSAESCKDTCEENELRCRDGGCLNEDQICDGTPECRDGSDESSDYCRNFVCTSYVFQCNYGACIDKVKTCDGVKDCFDGSDESTSLCGEKTTPTTTTTTTTTTPRTILTQNGQCVLPGHPENGHLSHLNPVLKYLPGVTVETSTVIKLQCDAEKNYVTSDRNFIICENGNWSSSIDCVHVCKLDVPRKAQVTCTKEGFKVSCDRATDGVNARFTCDNFYEINGRITNLFCGGDHWDNSIPQCIPQCGKKYYPGTPLIINGTDAKKGDYPWQVALYKEENRTEPDLICGGTLLRENIVITAAHCVTDSDGKSIGTPGKYPYIVAAGKYYRRYNISESGVEFSRIKEIYVHPYYTGYKYYYAFDVAILLMEKEFSYSTVILPICMDFETKNLPHNTTGVVTGWGYTEEGINRADKLKEIKIPLVDSSTCRSVLPATHLDYLSVDKICSGYLNKGIAVCQGDSGGGLVFKDPVNNKYYLRGLVSISPTGSSGSCDKNIFGLFTDVIFHESFIRKHLSHHSGRK